MLKISIVTVSFNQAPYLERAMRSVLEQNYCELEYIVVDAGSSDDSRGIIERYRDRIQKIVFEPDRGAADGLNKGFALASGQIYGYLNADDILLRGSLSKISNYFQQYPDIDVVSGHSQIIDENDQIIRISYSDPFSLKGHAYGASHLMQASTFFNSDLYRRSRGFNPDNPSNWDAELFVEFALLGAKFTRINSCLSGYRLHAESITSSGRLDKAIREYQRHIFEKIIGRERRPYDAIVAWCYRLQKYCRTPAALLERLFKGAVYRRKTSAAILRRV